MPNWTKEQQEAIDRENTNIIVSAGAGSGKTAVLTERVIRKLKQGINVDRLLVLTFTNKAAFEMKERIRNKILKDETLLSQLDYIDSAYITTFDSYALSVVKKYHYLLNVSSGISIIDSSIIYLEKKRIIDEIFDELYECEDEKFLNLIRSFCVKDDSDIKNAILEINDKLDLKYDKNEFLDNYLSSYYSEENISSLISQYNTLLADIISKTSGKLEDISSYVEGDYLEKLSFSIERLLSSSDYDEVRASLDIKLPMLPKNSEEEAKRIKNDISSHIKELNKLCVYDSTLDLIKGINETQPYVESIIKIINMLDARLTSYKYENDLYEFTDISKMAIRVLKENKEVVDELKSFYNEIMVDEYQDTSDLQEEFIKMIENNNVYMVGDIKQSIYRFRNANPYIFKNKYDNYADNIGGIKIDLNKNFRSRSEVISNINLIFNNIMTDLVGGANYRKSHQMIFGNTSYDELGKTTHSNNLEILNYDLENISSFSNDEVEIFTIANDIKRKINEGYQVFDNGILRNIKYSDFVVLLDRSNKFDLYKKVFEYFEIPLRKYADTDILKEQEILLIKNILGLIIKYNKKEFDTFFKYYFTSISRSFLFEYSDEEIYRYITNNNYNDSSVIGLINVFDINSLTPVTLLRGIIERLDLYTKLIKVGDVFNASNRIDSIIDIFENLSKEGYTIEDVFNYLENVLNDGLSIKVSTSDNASDCVNIMTIHKSKGLEYKICYYAGLSYKFNIRESTKRFIFDNKYGIIAPYFDEGIAYPFTKLLMQKDYIQEEISEKIRLFYVALTRAKEKMIVVGSFENGEKDMSECRSFNDLLNNLYGYLSDYIKEIDIEGLGLTKKYNLVKEYNYEEFIEKSDKYQSVEVEFSKEEIAHKSFSKKTHELLDRESINNMNLGSKIHYILETIDFKNNNGNSEYQEYINKFLICGLDFENAKIYHEYEFVSYDDQNMSHGIIDLMLEYDREIKIIDYKLKNISDENYYKQLKGYKDYIEKKTGKEASIYLYSIIDGKLNKISV